MTESHRGNPKSFISEHTVEYALVPKLKNILQKRFSIVTPLFPWATREGGTIARHLHKGERFKVVGLYPRRPKLLSANSSIITVKLNRQILLGAQCGMELGIPIIAGCPLAKNFWDLGDNPVCLWIKLDQGFVDDFELEIETSQPSYFENQISKFIFPSEEELMIDLDKRSEPIDFDTAMISFRTINGASRMGVNSYFGIIGGYKPVYFLLKDPLGI